MLSKIISLFVILLLPFQLSADQLKYTEATLNYINKANNTQQEIAHFKLFVGNMSEVHSTKKYRLLPGGEWDLEISMKSDELINVDFKSVDNGSLNKDMDIRYLQSESLVLFDSEKEILILSLIPKLQKQLAPIEITQDGFGLRDLCFNNSPVIVDNSFYIGKFSGFGERILFGIPEFYDVELSLKPLRDWKPIGEFADGTLRVELPNEQQVELLNVGIGPSGMKNAGPFIVYGSITKSNDTKESTLDLDKQLLLRDYSKEKAKVLLDAKKANPYVGLSRGTIGYDNTELSEQLYKRVGSIFEGQRCGQR